nr:hypothetical protein [Sphingomonas echinoides]
MMVFSWGIAAALLGAPPDLTVLSEQAPSDVVAALHDADRQLAFVDNCLERHFHDPADDDYAQRALRYSQIERSLYEIWSRPKGDLLIDHPTRRRARCLRTNIRAALLAADAGLLRAEQGFETATVALRSGVWMGPLHLCRETVSDARVDRRADRTEAENWDGNDPHLLIALRPAAAKAYATITRRHLGTLMAVRLGGEVVSRPRINVPITNGRFYLTGPEIELLDRAVWAALGPC